jgi:predicted phosphodiesterase
MKIIAISDTHGKLPTIPACDLFIHAGDFCPCFDHSPAYQAHWLETMFAPWLAEIEAEHKVFIPGNHDKLFQDHPDNVPALPAVNLQHTIPLYQGQRIWGSPWTPYFGGLDGRTGQPRWAFNFPRLDDGRQAFEHWQTLPTSTDIVVTHGPPFGHCDEVYDRALGLRLQKRAGCPQLAARIARVQPDLHIFGHIHMGHQSQEATESCFFYDANHWTDFHNVSCVDERYAMGRPFTEIDYTPRRNP